jgi:anaerobic selenocysteine-containing dehydrogenase
MAIERIHTYCAMCVSRCGVVATVSDGVLTKVTPDPAHPNGCICVKGTAAPEIVYAPDRLRAEHTGTWAQFRPAVVPPVHQARPDLEIIFDLALRLGLGDQFFGGDIEAAFTYHLAPSGLTVQQLRDHPAGVRVPGQTRFPQPHRGRHAVRLVTGMPADRGSRLRPLPSGGGERQPPHPRRRGRPDQRIGPAPQSTVPSPESVLDHAPYHHPHDPAP